jgi:hypothetical protein
MTANPFPDDSPVLARFPRSEADARGDRDAWPWLPGTVVSQCGPDEWSVVVVVRELATLEDGSQPPTGTPDQDLVYPVVFGDASELRHREGEGS